MTIRSLFVSAICLVLATANAALAIPAFPGAEGAAGNVTGGRGTPGSPGDVYIVTTLDDYDPDNDNDGGSMPNPHDAIEPPIVGSLRHGILTAPAAGRTIVFAVGGTIDLHDRLQFGGRDNITIAGQTAPGGGIALKNHEVTINNSDNIIFQHITFRPGDKLPGTNPINYTPHDYNPDAMGITGSSNIMIDHVTASWGVDETLSVTSNSNLVTVQWSTLTQGLWDAGHFDPDDDDGVGHSYGSLLNGGTYSFHHNLYAHSKSRHPRPQDNGAGNLKVDWVNNVIYNPIDRFGNSDGDDPYQFNMVANYGIKGPQSSSSNNFMMDSQDLDSTFYVEGNYMDTDRDLLLDGGPVNGSAVFTTSSRTIVGTRFPLTEVTTYTAEQAYIQVLSRAGANSYRDEIDKRLSRSVLNNLPGRINTQADWGGFPTIPGGSAPTDSNSDGVPDAWASDNGFNPTATDNANLLNRVFAPSGYTYLEEYIHSLTPNAYAPAATTQHTIRTGFGGGADAYVSESGGGTGNGTGATLDAAWAGGVNQAILMRFDLSEVVPGSLTSARLDLTAASAISGSHTFMVYGLEHEAAGWDWDESTVEFDTAPGLSYDGNTGTLGINNTFTSTNHPDNPDVLTLGQISISGAAADETISLTNPNLAIFLNLAAYDQGDASDNFVTLILQQTASASTASFYSQESSSPLLAPRLVVDAVMAGVPEILVGDYNGDGKVSAADYTVWRDSLGAATLTNRDPDNVGPVDLDDYQVWLDNYGNTFEVSGSGAELANIPEPTSIVLLSLASMAWFGFGRSRRSQC